MLWGNAGAADEVNRALDQIGADEDVWDKVTSGVRQAFYFRDRLDEGMDRLPTAHTRSILARPWPAKQGPPRFHANRYLARLALARSPGQTPIMADEPG